MDISCKAIFYLIKSNEWFKVIHKWEWYILHIIFNLHRLVVVVVVVVVVIVVVWAAVVAVAIVEVTVVAVVVVVVVAVVILVAVVVVAAAHKNNEKTQKWKWNTLQVKPEHVITKQQYIWSTGTKAQHPSKTGQLIRKPHKLLQNLF